MIGICDENREIFGPFVPIWEAFSEEYGMQIDNLNHDGDHQIGMHWNSRNGCSCQIGMSPPEQLGCGFSLGCAAWPRSSRVSRFRYVRHLGFFSPEDSDSLFAVLENGMFLAEGFIDVYNADGSPSLAPILEAIKDNYLSQRVVAAEALGHLGDERAIKPLLDALKDLNFLVRHCSFGALVDIADRGHVIDPALARVPLLEILKHHDDIDRVKAIEVLGRMGDKSVLPELRPLVDENDIRIRIAAYRALGRLKDIDSISALLNVLSRTRNSNNFLPALNMPLGEQLSPNGPLLVVTSEQRKYAIKWQLNVDNEEEIIAVAEALGHFDNTELISTLISLLGTDYSDAVKTATVKSLSKNGNLQSLYRLKKLAKISDERLRGDIAMAIEQIENRLSTTKGIKKFLRSMLTKYRLK